MFAKVLCGHWGTVKTLNQRFASALPQFFRSASALSKPPVFQCGQWVKRHLPHFRSKSALSRICAGARARIRAYALRKCGSAEALIYLFEKKEKDIFYLPQLGKISAEALRKLFSMSAKSLFLLASQFLICSGYHGTVLDNVSLSREWLAA